MPISIKKYWQKLVNTLQVSLNKPYLPLRRGFNLTEVVIAIFILALVTAPIYLLFSTSRRMNASAKHMSQAMSMASSYLSAAQVLPLTAVVEITTTQDKSLPPFLRPASLGVSEVLTGYERTLSIQKVPGSSGYYHAQVIVGYQSQPGSPAVSYILNSLLRGL